MRLLDSQFCFGFHHFYTTGISPASLGVLLSCSREPRWKSRRLSKRSGEQSINIGFVNSCACWMIWKYNCLRVQSTANQNGRNCFFVIRAKAGLYQVKIFLEVVDWFTSIKITSFTKMLCAVCCVTRTEHAGWPVKGAPEVFIVQELGRMSSLRVWSI